MQNKYKIENKFGFMALIFFFAERDVNDI